MANFSISATTLTFPDGTTQTTAAQSIPSATKTIFLQAAAPTGWTQCVTNTDFAIRIVNTTGGGTGGTVNFTTAFASQAVSGTNSGGAVAATTLSTCQIPSHSHSIYGSNSNGTTSRGANAANSTSIAGYPCNIGLGYVSTAPSNGVAYIQSTGGGASHTHAFTQPTFSGTAINLAVKYINAIVATKN